MEGDKRNRRWSSCERIKNKLKRERGSPVSLGAAFPLGAAAEIAARGGD